MKQPEIKIVEGADRLYVQVKLESGTEIKHITPDFDGGSVEIVVQNRLKESKNKFSVGDRVTFCDGLPHGIIMEISVRAHGQSDYFVRWDDDPDTTAAGWYEEWALECVEEKNG